MSQLTDELTSTVRRRWSGRVTRRWSLVVTAVIVLGLLGLLLAIAVDVQTTAGFLGAASASRFFRWNAYIVAALGATGILAPEWARRLGVAVLAPLVVLCVFVFVALAGTLGALLVAAATLLGCWFVGDRLWRRLAPGSQPLALVGLALGTGLLAVAIELLGRAALLTWWVAALLIIPPAACGAVMLGRRRSELPLLVRSIAETRLRFGAFAALVVLAMWTSIWAAAPEIQFDALYGKAWLPQHWAHLGRIDTSLVHPVLGEAGASQVLALPGHLLHAPAVGRFLQYWVAVAIVGTLWAWGDRWNRSAGPLAAAVVGMTPLLVWQASTAYDDVMLTMWALALALAVMSFADGTGDARAGLLLGGLGGACIAGKLHLAAFAVALVALWAVSMRRVGALRRIGGAFVGMGALALPIPAFTWAATGNPFFPLLNNVFRSPYYPPVDEHFNLPFLKDGGFTSLLSVPWTAIREPSKLMEAVPPGVFGLLSVALVLAILIGWRRDRASRLVWVAMLVALAVWWRELRYLRYLLPYAVVAVALLVPSASGWWSRRGVSERVRRLADAALAGVPILMSIALFAPTLASFWNVPERLPLSVVLGRQSKVAYERTTISYGAAIDELNRLARPGDVVVASGAVAGRTLLRNDLDLTPGWELSTRLALDGPVPTDPDRLYAALTRRHVKWALLSADGQPLGAGIPDLQPAVEKYGRVVFAAENWLLVRLAPNASVRYGPVQAYCNPGFAGGGSCWQGSRDSRPGLTGSETAGGPVTQTVLACPGRLYRASIDTGGTSPIRVFVSFDTAPWDYDYVDVAPGSSGVVYATAPARASRVTVTVQPLASGSVAKSVHLSAAGVPCGR